MKKKKVVIVIVIILALIGLSGKIFYDYKKDNKPSVIIRTEKEQIASRFPNLGEFQSCYWEGDSYNSENDRIPGPSSYWIKCFVKVDDALINDYIKKYDMKETATSIHLEFTPPDFNSTEISWLYSDSFNAYLKPQTFSGKFYIDIKNKYIYFEVDSIN